MEHIDQALCISIFTEKGRHNPIVLGNLQKNQRKSQLNSEPGSKISWMCTTSVQHTLTYHLHVLNLLSTSSRFCRSVVGHGPQFIQYWTFYGTITDVYTDRNLYKRGTTNRIRQRCGAYDMLYFKGYHV